MCRRRSHRIDGELRAGEYTLGFDGSGFSAGQYIYRIEAGSQISSGALFLLR